MPGDLPRQLADGIQRTVGGARETVESGARLEPAAPAGDAPHQLFGVIAQIKQQALVLLLKSPQIGGALQGQQQLLGMPWFEQVLPDAGLVDAGDDVLGIGIAGKDQAHRVRPLAAHPAQELDARGTRHALVGEHDMHELARHDLLAVLGGLRGEHREVLLQRAAQGLQRARLVVDHQHGEGGGGFHAGTVQPRSRCRAR